MPSRSSEESFPLGPICLPLLKLSYATVSNDSVSPIPWIHLSSKHNLLAVFENVRSQDSSGQLDERSIFKVMRDPEVVEHIDLGNLAAAAQQALAEAQDPKSRDRMPKVAIIVKAPVIAIRYPMSGGQVRRFQIRFAKEEDYYETMKILSRAKVPTGEAGSLSSRRPQTATSIGSSNLHPNDSASQIGARPASQQPPFVPAFSSQAPSISLASTISQITTPTSMMPPPTHTAGQSYGHQHHVHPFHDFHTLSGNDHYPSQLPASTTSPGACAFESTVASAFDPAGPNYPHSSVSASQPTGPWSPASSQHNSISMYEPRPSTAPVIESQHLSQVLPPRRNLPFIKPASHNTSIVGGPNKDQRLHLPGISVSNIAEIAPVPIRSSANGVSTGVIAHQTDVTGSDLSQTTTTTTASKRKRAPAKKPPKTPAPKKPRAPASRKRRDAPEERPLSTVRSADELLKQPQSTTIGGGNLDASSEPRVLRSRLAQDIASMTDSSNDERIVPGHMEEPMSRSISGDGMSAVVTHSCPTTSQDSGDFPAKCTTLFHSTSALDINRQSLGELDPNTEFTSGTNMVSSEKSPARSQSLAQPPSVDTSTVTLISPVADQSPGLTAHRLPPAMASLMRNPNFAPTRALSTLWTDQDRPWESLPQELQDQVLETYVCEQLLTPGFEKFCMIMEGVWTNHMVL